MLIDFHTHILPDIDDGSTCAQMSVMMLKRLKEQGVDKVLLTPHFYAYCSSVKDFCSDRSRSLKALCEELDKEPLDIKLYLGAEVLYFEELWRVEDLKNFCIKGTDYIMIEMPLSPWTDTMIATIERMVGMGLTPIIAHFERYLKYSGNKSKIYTLLEMGALLQMNCNSLCQPWKRRKALKFIRKGMVFLLGTDCHNIFERAPNYEEAISYLKKKLDEREYKRILSMSKWFLDKATPVYSGKTK